MNGDELLSHLTMLCYPPSHRLTVKRFRIHPDDWAKIVGVMERKYLVYRDPSMAVIRKFHGFDVELDRTVTEVRAEYAVES